MATIDFSVLHEDAGHEAHQSVITDIFYASRENPSLRQAMVEDGLVAAVVSAMQRPYNKSSHETLCKVLAIVVVIPGIFDDGVEEADIGDANLSRIVAAKAIVNQGGLDIVLAALQDDATVPFDVSTCLASIYSLMTVLESEEAILLQVAMRIMPVVVLQMATNAIAQNDPKIAHDIYKNCMVSFVNCMGAGHPPLDDDTVHRMAQVTFIGLCIHNNDSDAQDMGKRFLSVLVGSELAMEMIDRAETHHCEDAECSCAA